MKPCDACDAALDGLCLAALPHQPCVTEFSTDGVWVARIEIAAEGTWSPMHSHAHPHMTLVERGSVQVHTGNEAPRIITAPAAITIPARQRHLFLTLEDNVVLLCIHSTARSGSVEIAAEHQIVEAL